MSPVVTASENEKLNSIYSITNDKYQMEHTHTDTTKETEKPFIDTLHASLVTHKIITNPRVIKCGTYFSKECGYF